MESTNNNNNNNNNQMFLCEFKELRKELSAMKTRIVQLEKSHEKQQEKLDILVRENHMLKKKSELNHLNGNKEGEPALKRKKTEKDQDQGTEEKIEAKCTSVSVGKKKTKINNKNDAEEVALLSRHDNGDSFDSLSDDLLHKVIEFDGNCYSKFGSINKRCKNIYDVKEYKLKKHTCMFGYGTIDMMLERYLQKRREGTLDYLAKSKTARAVIWYNRLDAIDWMIQLGDSELLKQVCYNAAFYGRINILTKVFLKSNLTMLGELLDDEHLCYFAALYGQLKTLKWLRKYGAEWDADTFDVARDGGYDKVVEYLRAEGCPEPPEDRDEYSESEQVSSDDEDGDY